jgi:hypothetical protein
MDGTKVPKLRSTQCNRMLKYNIVLFSFVFFKISIRLTPTEYANIHCSNEFCSDFPNFLIRNMQKFSDIHYRLRVTNTIFPRTQDHEELLPFAADGLTLDLAECIPSKGVRRMPNRHPRYGEPFMKAVSLNPFLDRNTRLGSFMVFLCHFK